MPVTFKNLGPLTPKGDPHGGSFDDMRTALRQKLGLPEDAEVGLGATTCTIRHKGISLTVPFGIGAIKTGSGKIQETRDALSAFLPVSTPAIPQATETKPEPEPQTAWNDLDDEKWMIAVSKELFPGAVHLSKATKMHQLVHGTDGGSLYRSAFIGDELRGACRVKGQKVSFRFTTHKGECPPQPILNVLDRLGVNTVYPDRVTTHAAMKGPYEGNEAEYRMLFGAYYAALRPWLTSNFPSIKRLMEGVN